MTISIDIEIPVEISVYLALRNIGLVQFISEIDKKYTSLRDYYTAEKTALIKRIDRLI